MFGRKSGGTAPANAPYAAQRRSTLRVIQPGLAVISTPPKLGDLGASRLAAVGTINGRDRPGLLHDVTQALTDEGLQISSAHISTFGERVVDVFYVKDVFGLKMDSETKTLAVRTRLLDTIAVDESAIAAE